MQIQHVRLQGQINQVATIVVILARLIEEQCLLYTAVKWTEAFCLKIKAKQDMVTRFKHLPNSLSVIKDMTEERAHLYLGLLSRSVIIDLFVDT